MSANTEPTSTDTPPFRYTSALAQDIELRWQDWWAEHGTFETPNPSGPLGDPELAAARGEKLFVLDMFPYPSGTGLHVGHPLGFIGTDVYARFKRMTGHNVLHTMGFDAFGLPAEQFAVETGQHPRITTEQNVNTYRRQLRRLGLGHDPRRSVSTTDPQYYRWTQWIFSQIFNSWLDPELDRARPISELVAEFESGTRADPRRTRLGRNSRQPAQPDRRRSSSGVRQRRASQLVPRPGHGGRQRGGHRRRAFRSRQLPCVQTQHAAVDDADHVVRRPPDRRPRTARLDRLDQVDAAQLDRAQPRRQCALRLAGRRVDGVHHPARHVVRRHLHGAGTRASVRRVADHGRASRRGHRIPAQGRRHQRDRPHRRHPREDRGVHRFVRRQPAQRRPDPDLDRRLRADGLRHRRHHGGAVRRPARLRVRRQVRARDPCDPAPARGLAGRPGRRSTFRCGTRHQPVADRLRRRRALRQLVERHTRPQPARYQGRGHPGHQRVARGERQGRTHDHLQAARLAVQPPALLGRAVSGRLRRRRQSAHPARRHVAGRTARDRQLLTAHVRCRRRVLQS